LQELPGQTAELSAAIQRLAGGQGVLQDVEVAQRIAHTVKGAGNTVGVRGIANLTHHMEDIMLALSKHQTLPNRPLAEALLTAADCLETMSEALVGLSAPPAQAREVLQTILDWANRIDREGLPKGEEVLREPVRPAALGAEVAEVAEATAAAATVEPAATDPLVRVPASLVDELLRLVGESIILTGQIQERARQALRQARTMQMQHQVFQQLSAELEQVVEIRGISPIQGQTTGKGDFDLLELEQYNELNTVTHRLLEASADSRALDQEIHGEITVLDNLLVMQGRLHRESQEVVLRTRMIPVKTIVPRLQRSVRQTCRLTDKEVNFTVGGGETLMDSNLLMNITDPLMHVLRNAIDHGIEPPARRQARGKNPVGRIELSFVREGHTIVVRCQDDGAGLDFAAIRDAARQRGLISVDATPGEAELSQLILSPGFSTRTEATQTSGRGIGLDMVNSRMQELKGSLQIHSEANRGCRVEFRLPVTLIAIHALVVRLCEQRFAVSSHGVEQILYAGLGEIRPWGEKAIYQLGDDFHELASLEDLLKLPPDRRASERHVRALLLVREGTGATRAVLVQEVLDSRDLVVKPLGRYFPKIPGIVGATILGDGGVVPVLDLPELLRAPLAARAAPGRVETARPGAAPQPRRRMALVVDDSLSARRALAQAVEDAGLEVRTARDGLEAVAIIEAHRPDLLLVDLEMPGMNGLELTSHVRAGEATRTLPVIMVTSRSTAKHRREAQKVGVNFYMTKPFADQELLNNIHAALSAV
ncbi:MAG TPA: response regulator, partial [Thiobacillaceae bacterium]|nr:response regulator [Thiobacillaceae bacterium]